MKEIQELDFDNLVNGGYPVCPVCGTPLTWTNDYDLCDVAEPKDDTYKNAILTSLHCSGCNRLYDIVQSDDGNHLLSYSTEDEHCHYTDFARRIFG